MSGKEVREAIAKTYGVSTNGQVKQVVNRAIRTLPGGPETLDAIEAANAARIHAAIAGAVDRIVAIDAGIERLESIRSAMVDHVLKTAGVQP